MILHLYHWLRVTFVIECVSSSLKSEVVTINRAEYSNFNLKCTSKVNLI